MNPLILYGIAFIALLVLIGGGIAAFLSRTAPGDEEPVTASSVLDAMNEGAVVLAPDETVLMANIAFRSQFSEEPVGEPLESVLESHPDVLDAATAELDDDNNDDRVDIETGGDGEQTSTTVSIDTASGNRRLKIQVTPIGSGIHEDRKRLVRFEDVTDCDG